MAARRYLMLIAVLVGMGLSTVWWKTQTLSTGYETVRIERDLHRAEEEESHEDSLLAALTAPTKVAEVAVRLGLSGERESRVADTGRRGDSERRRVVATH